MVDLGAFKVSSLFFKQNYFIFNDGPIKLANYSKNKKTRDLEVTHLISKLKN